MLKHGWWLKYNYVCQPCDFSDDADAIAMANIVWWYFFGKFTEFLDTIFFVLRKKRDQISALHVIHHCLVPVICWWGLRFSPGGHGTLYAMINSMIHVMMYTYYMLSAMGPQLQKYLWWKKYLTTMQLVQFTIALFHGALGLTNGCDFRKSVLYIQCANALMFFGLFSNFYLQVRCFFFKQKCRIKMANFIDCFINCIIINRLTLSVVGCRTHRQQCQWQERLITMMTSRPLGIITQ